MILIFTRHALGTEQVGGANPISPTNAGMTSYEQELSAKIQAKLDQPLFQVGIRSWPRGRILGPRRTNPSNLYWCRFAYSPILTRH